MIKKFLPVLFLLAISLAFCIVGDAATVPPWWMIGQSATEYGSATFTVPLSTTQTLDVTGKTTTGTLESGAATFTGNISMDKASMQVTNPRTTTGAAIGINARSYVWLGANLNGLGGKLVDASPSAVLEVYSPYNYPRLYTSDAGSSDPYQYGPYSVWHGGMTSFLTSGSTFACNTSDGSDTSSQWFGGGGGIADSRGAYIGVYGNETTAYGGRIYITAGNVASGAIHLRTGASADRIRIYYNGDTDVEALVGSGNRAVYSDPTGTLTNSTSDGTLKTDVQEIVGALDKIRALRGVTYRWIDTDNRGPQREMGMIAQEVQPIVPEVIGQNSDGKLSLDYPKLTALLIEAVKQQQAQIENLKSRIETLEGK